MPIGNHTLPTELLDTCTDGILYCFSKWAYEVTSGTFWTFALLGFLVAIFAATGRLGTNKAFGFASFVGMIGGIFLAILGLMPWWIATLFILTGVAGIAMMILSEEK